MLLELTLSRIGGFDAIVVRSPTEALEMVRNESFDLILADAMMPEMNGGQFFREVRALDPASTVPLVALSAASPEELGWSTNRAVHTAWLRKPFIPRELASELLQILERSRKAG